MLDRPFFMEAERLGGFKGRGTEVFVRKSRITSPPRAERQGCRSDLKRCRPTCPLGCVSLFFTSQDCRAQISEEDGWTGPAARTSADPQPPDALWRARRRSSGEQDSTCRPSFRSAQASTRADGRRILSRSSDKPKKQQKQKAQKTLKERRSEKRAAKKLGSGSFLPAGS